MAFLLKISKRTIDNHLRNIREKFGVKKTAGILKLAVSRGDTTDRGAYDLSLAENLTVTDTMPAK
jgi:hypothetical protein